MINVSEYVISFGIHIKITNILSALFIFIRMMKELGKIFAVLHTTLWMCLIFYSKKESYLNEIFLHTPDRGILEEELVS